jgi:hypothetical protein
LDRSKKKLLYILNLIIYLNLFLFNSIKKNSDLSRQSLLTKHSFHSYFNKLMSHFSLCDILLRNNKLFMFKWIGFRNLIIIFLFFSLHYINWFIIGVNRIRLSMSKLFFNFIDTMNNFKNIIYLFINNFFFFNFSFFLCVIPIKYNIF